MGPLSDLIKEVLTRFTYICSVLYLRVRSRDLFISTKEMVIKSQSLLAVPNQWNLNRM